MIKQLTAVILMANVSNSANLMTVFLDYQSASYVYNQNYNEYNGYYDKYLKTTNNTPLNNYIDIHTNNYSENYAYNDPNEVKNYTLSNLYIMQIRPFYTLRGTELDLKIRIADMDYNTTYYITKSAFYTTEDLSTYIDVVNWSSPEIADNPANIYIDALENTNNLTEIWNDNVTEITEDEYHTKPLIEINNIPMDDTVTTYLLLYYKTSDLQDQWALTNSLDSTYTYIYETSLKARMINYTNGPEVVDIPGLMFTILSMPFAFISQAFNLTLFKGTAYQFNVGQFFLGLIGIAILLWVLKIIMGKTDLSSLVQDAHATKLENTKFKHAKQLEKQKHSNKVAREQQRHENATKEKSK